MLADCLRVARATTPGPPPQPHGWVRLGSKYQDSQIFVRGGWHVPTSLGVWSLGLFSSIFFLHILKQKKKKKRKKKRSPYVPLRPGTFSRRPSCIHWAYLGPLISKFWFVYILQLRHLAGDSTNLALINVSDRVDLPVADWSIIEPIRDKPEIKRNRCPSNCGTSVLSVCLKNTVHPRRLSTRIPTEIQTKLTEIQDKHTHTSLIFNTQLCIAQLSLVNNT